MVLVIFVFLFIANLTHGEIKLFEVKHGDTSNKLNGGFCSHFKALNDIECCSGRDDECYMIHFDTLCYCDSFCDRFDHDCCPDATEACSNNYTSTIRPIPETYTTRRPIKFTTRISSRPSTQRSTSSITNFGINCVKDGKIYNEGELVEHNCNKYICKDGSLVTFDGSQEKTCLIDTNLIDQINSGSYSWTALSYSKFWGKTLSYGYKNRLGALLSTSNQRPFNPYAGYSLDDLDSPPTDYDFRDFLAYKKLEPIPIRDQGDCPSSWAFSTIDVATDRLSKVTDGRYGNQTYSAQMLISCAILKNNANGCSPSTTDYAWNYLNHFRDDGGVVLEECYPYTNANNENADECKIHSLQIKQNDVYCPSNSRRYDSSILLASPAYPLKVDSDEDIMREIINQGPVQAIFKVYPDFFMYKSGVYKPLEGQYVPPEYEEIGYHAVRILGWGTSEYGEPYWLCANSWGEDFGEQGYFRIKRGVCEINDHIYAAWGHAKLNGRYIYNALKFKSIIKSMYKRKF